MIITLKLGGSKGALRQGPSGVPVSECSRFKVLGKDRTGDRTGKRRGEERRAEERRREKRREK